MSIGELAVQGGAEYSRQLADQLQLPLVDKTTAEHFPYVLRYTEKGLAIAQTGRKAAGPVVVDFAGGGSAHRRQQGGGELIVKAVAGDKKNRPSVLDATAGLGRDSFVLASWGYPVTLCERSPIVAAVLNDGLERARYSDDSELLAIMARMKLETMDAITYMQTLTEATAPDAIVIDPMFPASKKSALVKKEMQAFHHVVGADPDSASLLDQALVTARHRVIVKRPKKAEYLAGIKPNFSVEGKAIRFDIYSLRAYGK
ncbi:MAG: class I SAM-dependent methyltransferase [Oceanicoccus sp.]|uniref:class I SAM-dependent methyltransferase n=1 Tax=Oceanicoccus sp. TaxID=2691044 RepID=UPI00260EBAD2|nr:class I SAM-dependent methyltransferase [Oceanicoccus sp.]MCP3908533.1 class I SAM-dependent methyltransferase [Oceanicoccus sp.]MDG1773222.1 class I SAM-dependent methyltransferase [Oceanicoccus sp.]